MVRDRDAWWMNQKNTWGKLAYTKDTNTYDTPKAKQVEPRMQWAFYQPPNTTPDVPTLPAPSPTPEPSPTPQPQPQEIPAPSRDGIARRAVTAIVGAAEAATSAVAAGILIATTTPAGKSLSGKKLFFWSDLVICLIAPCWFDVDT